jgi:hypothetical protein
MKIKLSQLKIIPSKPLESKVLSEDLNNLWELHELYPTDQEVELVFDYEEDLDDESLKLSLKLIEIINENRNKYKEIENKKNN